MATVPFFLTESVSPDFQETPTIGGFSAGAMKNDFNAVFEEAASELKGKGIDIMRDLNVLLENSTAMSTFKDALLAPLYNEAKAEDFEATLGHASATYEAVSALWDNTVDDFITESQGVTALLPIKTLDLPIIVKAHTKAAAKDIIQTEVAKSPIIKKHIEKTWVVDRKSQKKWEYPRCFFDGTFTEFYAAGSGLPITADKDDLKLPIYNYDIIGEMAAAGLNVVKGHDKLSLDVRVVKVYDEDGTGYPVDLTFSIQDGRLNNSQIRIKKADGTYLEDVLMGQINFSEGLVSVSSCSGAITNIELGGYLSNENNERTVGVEYTREEKTFQIKDGFRMNVPYSVEQLQDAKALLDIDLYKKTYDNITDIHVDLEDSNILKYLDDEFDKYNGVEVDTLGFESWVKTHTFDCDHSKYHTVALRSEYIEKELKFRIDRAVIDLADTAKIENMTFVMYGNPRYISLLGKNVNWVVRSGDSLGGVRLNYSYGVMNSGDVKIQVVSAAKIAEKKNGKANNSLRIIPFPITPELFTFKHYKYSMHILTNANSGYRDPDLPGGSMTNIMAVNRCTTESIQGIQSKLMIENSDDFIF